MCRVHCELALESLSLAVASTVRKVHSESADGERDPSIVLG
jgi:hypothetical protein